MIVAEENMISSWCRLDTGHQMAIYADYLQQQVDNGCFGSKCKLTTKRQ
jgi:hypothetical protein